MSNVINNFKCIVLVMYTYVLMIYLENYCIVFLIYSVTILSLTSLNSCNHIVLDAAQIYYNLFVKQNLRLNNSNLHEISPSTTVNIPQLFCGKSNNQCLNNIHMENATTASTDSNPYNQAFKHSNWQFNNRHLQYKKIGNNRICFLQGGCWNIHL